MRDAGGEMSTASTVRPRRANQTATPPRPHATSRARPATGKQAVSSAAPARTALAPDAPRTWFELLFLSFTNLTSVGLSDIAPIQPQARAVVMIEQVAGLLYVAFVISRIVGLTIARERKRPRPDE